MKKTFYVVTDSSNIKNITDMILDPNYGWIVNSTEELINVDLKGLDVVKVTFETIKSKDEE